MFAVRSANKRFPPALHTPDRNPKWRLKQPAISQRSDGTGETFCALPQKKSLPNSASLALALVLPHINTSTDDESRVPGYLFETSKAVRLRITHCEVMPESPLECSCNEYNVCVCVCACAKRLPSLTFHSMWGSGWVASSFTGQPIVVELWSRGQVNAPE